MSNISQEEFLERVFQHAPEDGGTIETTRKGRKQIDFGHKKLHAGHLNELYPDILTPGAHIPTVIEKVAPGRPCVHKPMRKIIEQIKRELK